MKTLTGMFWRMSERVVWDCLAPLLSQAVNDGKDPVSSDYEQHSLDFLLLFLGLAS